MTEAFLDGRVTVHSGDCRDVLARVEEDSIDACVTDPPYHLISIVKRFSRAAADDVYRNAEARKIFNQGTSPYGNIARGFMGKAWDGGDIAFDPATWRAIYRVLKPGAHLVAFGAPKNFGFMQVAIAQAGFEVRDVLAWLFGSGFPKSHDVSKGIDRVGGMSPAEQSRLLRERREASGLSRDEVAASVGCTSASVRDWEEGRARASGRALEWIVPCDDYRTALADLLGYSADERRLVGVATDRRGDGSVIGLGHSGQLRNGGVTDAARQWAGWGTALKPAFEPIILARKPLVGTVAENVLRYGTGALNIDGCRVATNGEDNPSIERRSGSINHLSVRPARETEAEGRMASRQSPEAYRRERAGETLGRWPANVVHDGSDEVIEAFPYSASGAMKHEVGAYTGDSMTGFLRGRSGPDNQHGDSGSAARFFYTAKADADDRLGSKHPTVKPLDLMQWLVRLVTPPGGLVLDPFAGTGTTGEAAWREGCRAVLVEADPESLADIRRRMALALAGPDERERESIKARGKTKGYDDLPLFVGEPKP